ncbi:MAG: MjaI family restriction endonuclease [Thermoflexales bacterium]|nr:MjaI family restriction endonuclease [Thermoflexales bacterium]
MAKEWVLNIALNRWQLDHPEYVGRVAEAIRACAPRSLEEWEQYYFNEVPQKHVPANWQMWGNTMREHLEEIGRRLYVKISENLRMEIDAITEEDCIEYVRDTIIRRTYEGYLAEKRTLHAQPEERPEVIDPVHDELRRLSSDDQTSPHP